MGEKVSVLYLFLSFEAKWASHEHFLKIASFFREDSRFHNPLIKEWWPYHIVPIRGLGPNKGAGVLLSEKYRIYKSFWYVKCQIGYWILLNQYGIRVKRRLPSMFKANMKVAAGTCFLQLRQV